MTVSFAFAGQFVDTIVVIVIAFGGTYDAWTLLKLIFSGYMGKVIYEVMMTPITYLVVNGLKRSEGIDVFDNNTDFNPFHGAK